MLDSRPARFLAVGIIVTAIDVGLSYLLIQITGTKVIAVTLGFLAGLLAGYLLHAKISFSASLKPMTQVPRLLVLVALNYLQTIGFVLLATEGFNLSTIAGKIISLPVVAATSYFISKHWVYSSALPINARIRPD